MRDPDRRSLKGPVSFGDPRLKAWSVARSKRAAPPPTGFDRTRLLPDRIRALRLAWIGATVFVMLVARPGLQAFMAGGGSYIFDFLRFQYQQQLFDIVSDGMIWAIVWGGPVWAAMRFWIGRQGDTSVGGRPATMRSFILIWALSALVYLVLFLDVAPDAMRLLAPHDWPGVLEVAIHPDIIGHMAGVAMLFALYRWRRPRDGTD